MKDQEEQEEVELQAQTMHTSINLTNKTVGWDGTNWSSRHWSGPHIKMFNPPSYGHLKCQHAELHIRAICTLISIC